MRNHGFLYFLPVILLAVAAACLAPGRALGGSGGDITQDGPYTIHTFTTDDTFDPPAGVTEVEVLVVGGGGGGGAANAGNAGGGGGAGGLIYESDFLTNGGVTVVVGEGGAGGSGNAKGLKGSDSQFGTLVAEGGGGGGGAPGSAQRLDGDAGGSGGGGATRSRGNQFGSGGAGVGNQGNNGGDALYEFGAGGGGGAGTSGSDATQASAGEGGNGLFYMGDVFAGGGGGGSLDGTSLPGTGGNGGGGDGGDVEMPGQDALPATGGGGGGSGGGGEEGGNGGSGIVIVRYITPENTITAAGDVSLTIGPAGIAQAGLGHDPVDDDTSTLSWTSVVDDSETNKITVSITHNTVPAGLELRVDTDLPGVDPVVLNDSAQDFITGISAGSVSGQALVYTLEVVDWGALFATTESITVEYTITAEP